MKVLVRLPRRLVTISALGVATLLALVLSPVLLLGAAALDLVTGPRRRRFLRLGAMAYGYLFFEWAALLGAGGLWLATGFGRFAHASWSLDAHRRLQAWWTGGLLAVMGKTLGLRLETEDLALAGLPGPLLVAGRHVSFGDAVLPSALVGGANRVRVRYVLKEELAWDPLLDVIGHRMPNYFVDRRAIRPDEELEPIRRLAAGMDDRSGCVIFPEGRFFTPTRQARAVGRLRRRDPELAAKAAQLRHLLPPRPGGTLAILEGSPTADVVLYAHVGFEGFSSLDAIFKNVPFRDPVRVRFWRFPRADVPEDETGRVHWLMDRWLELDAWIDANQPQPSRLGATPPARRHTNHVRQGQG